MTAASEVQAPSSLSEILCVRHIQYVVSMRSRITTQDDALFQTVEAKRVVNSFGTLGQGALRPEANPDIELRKERNLRNVLSVNDLRKFGSVEM